MRRWIFAALYLSEGAPIGFLWWYLPAELRIAGVPPGEIAALTGTLALPWALKFLWAPLLDRWRGPRWGYRSWMLLMQTLMAATLLPLAFLDWTAQFPVVYALCVLHAFAASTQDVAIDALAIATTERGGRGDLNGWMQVGMFSGRALFGGLALRVADDLGIATVVGALCAVVIGVGLLASFTKLLRAPGPPPAERASLVHALRAALSSRLVRWAALFALVSGAAFEGAAGLMSPFLVDRGYLKADIGTFLGFAAVACMAGGSFMGGRLADRFGPVPALRLLLPLLAASAALFAFLPGPAPLFAAIALFYLLVGLFVTTSYAIFMDVTEERFAATQFTTLMACTNLCEFWVMHALGLFVGPIGYAWSFVGMALIALVALPLLPRLVTGKRDPGT